MCQKSCLITQELAPYSPELKMVRAGQVEAVMEACRAQGAHLAHIADNLPLRLPGAPPPGASALPSSSSAAAQVRKCCHRACGTTCGTHGSTCLQTHASSCPYTLEGIGLLYWLTNTVGSNSRGPDQTEGGCGLRGRQSRPR